VENSATTLKIQMTFFLYSIISISIEAQ